MKSKIKALALSVALMTTVCVQQAVAQEDITDPCVVASDLAKVIMEHRQLGTPISKVVDLAGGNSYVIGLVLIAYDTPRFSTSEYQQEAVTDFSNMVGLVCYKELSQ